MKKNELKGRIPYFSPVAQVVHFTPGNSILIASDGNTNSDAIPDLGEIDLGDIWSLV